jgi:hypothetical protein
VAAVVLAVRAPLSAPLRAVTVVGGVCGVLGPFFFPIFFFWLWAIAFGVWTLASGARASTTATAQHQPA